MGFGLGLAHKLSIKYTSAGRVDLSIFVYQLYIGYVVGYCLGIILIPLPYTLSENETLVSK